MTIPPTRAPAPMDHNEKSRLRAAAFLVTRLYPGPAGEILSREIWDWHEFGYRLSLGGRVMRLVADVEGKEAARAAAEREERAAEAAREAVRQRQPETRPESRCDAPAGPAPSEAGSAAHGHARGQQSASQGDGRAPIGGKPYGSLAALWAAHRARQWGHTASEVHR